MNTVHVSITHQYYYRASATAKATVAAFAASEGHAHPRLLFKDHPRIVRLIFEDHPMFQTIFSLSRCQAIFKSSSSSGGGISPGFGLQLSSSRSSASSLSCHRHQSSSSCSLFRVVELPKTEEGLGFNVMGGKEQNSPIYISRIIPGRKKNTKNEWLKFCF